jgi:hypothetical protein
MSEPVPAVVDALPRWSSELEEARSAGDGARAGLLAGVVDWANARLALGTGSEEAGSHDTVLQAFSWGDVDLLFLPGEPFVEYGLALKTRHGPRLMVCAYGNDAPGYIPTAASLPEGGYEIDSAYMYYGLPGPFTEQAEALLLGACETLLVALAADTLDG